MAGRAFTAERMTRIPPYLIQQIFTRAKGMEQQGRRLVHLDLGEPDLPTPNHIIEAAYRAMRDGYTRYTPSLGLIELREALAEHWQRLYGLAVDPGGEILVTPGSKHALFCAIAATVNPGDEVLVPDLDFPSYDNAVVLCDGAVVRVPLDEAAGFTFDLDVLAARITPRTRMLLLNSPHNPTGAVLPPAAIARIAELACAHDLLVVSDDVYEQFIYGQGIPQPIRALPGMAERAIVVNSFSKTYCMTGWRLGYAVGPPKLIARMRQVQEATTTCPTAFCQMAGVEALRGPQTFIAEMRAAFDRRRRRIVEGLNAIPGVRCQMPPGAFFVFPRVDGLGLPAVSLCEQLLEQAGVVTFPGDAFGPSGDRYLRLSYATALEEIERGLQLIREAVATLTPRAPLIGGVR